MSLTWAGLAWAQTPAPTPATTPKTGTPPKAHAPAKANAAKTNAASTKAKSVSEPATPAVAAAAPAPDSTKSHKGEEQALKWFSMLDANGDGRISRKEAEVGFRLRPSLENDFKSADLNGDGYLTQQEIRTVADRRRVERQARRERERAAAARQAGAINNK